MEVLMTTSILNLGMVPVIMEESLQKTAIRRETKCRIRKGNETGGEIGTGIMIVTLETATWIEVTEGCGENTVMIIIGAGTLRGGGIMIEIGKTGIGASLARGLPHAHAHAQRAKGPVVLTWRLLLLQC